MTDKVATPSRERAQGLSKLAKIRALRGGVEAMRQARELYLPKEEGEEEGDYVDRLKRSWLLPALTVAIKRMADRVFAREITLGDDVPSELSGWAENITSEGRNLNEFARDVFEDGLEAGISFIFVDGPERPENLTLREEQEGNYRPYMVHYRVEQVIGWKTETLGNKTVLAQLRLLESVEKPDPTNEFEDEEVLQVRVFDRIGAVDGQSGYVGVRIFQKLPTGWQQTGTKRIDLPEIPIACFYTSRTGFFQATPPFEHLADLNIAHWQSASDQRAILHFARVPILALYGYEPDQVKIGGNRALATTKGPQEARIEIVEHTGAAIEAGRNDLKDLEERMVELGYEPMIPRPGNPTATGKAIDDGKANTPLRDMAFSLKDALEMALDFMGQFAGREPDTSGSVNVNTDYGLSIVDGEDLDFLLKAVNTGRISMETFHKECIRRGVLMEGLDTEDELERIADEMPEPVVVPGMAGSGEDDEDDDDE